MTDLNRRAHDRYEVEMEVIDDTDPRKLTLSEIKELKRLANMSKTARTVLAISIGAVSLIGLPSLVEFLRTHWR